MSGGSGYAYVDTRIRAMKSLLITRDTYPKLLKMNLIELTHFLEENTYRSEIDELAVRYKGINLLEYALMRNMANTFKRILNFSVGNSKVLISAYLDRWDVWNIKTGIRGKYARAPEMEILGNLVPAGQYNEKFFVELISNTNTVEEVVEKLKDTPYYPILTKAMSQYQETNNLSSLEDALDQFYFEKIADVVEGKLAEYVALETDTLNLLVLLRLKKIEAPITYESFLGNGKKFTRNSLLQLGQKDYAAIIEEANNKFPGCDITVDNSLSEIYSKLTRKRMMATKKLLSSYKLNINPVLGYITSKKIEVDNLRLLTRGKHAGLPEELIEKQLII